MSLLGLPRVDGHGRLDLRRPDTGLQVGHQGAVVICGADVLAHKWVVRFLICNSLGISYPTFPGKETETLPQPTGNYHSTGGNWRQELGGSGTDFRGKQGDGIEDFGEKEDWVK